MALDRGTILKDRYRVVEILGQGGMGAVYRAVDQNLGLEVALKENLFTTEEYARQFRREAVILAALRHPNLTRVTDHFVIEGQGQYLVMDYIEGEDLRQRMDRVGVIAEEEAVIIGAAVCDALNYLHTRTPSIVHRDIKPGNVKITPNGQIFLVDFGLAKIIQTGQATTTGARAMTPGYSPPEQYGTARTDNRSDLFSLGATLYASLTGTIPEDALARAMDQTELTPIRKRNPKVSRRLGATIEKSLAVRPDDRYQDALEFKQALLSARGISTRQREGEYKVDPPPGNPNDGSNLHDAVFNDGPSEYTPAGRVKSPLPFPSSATLDEPKPRRTIWLLLTILMLFAIIAGIAAYTFYPAWTNRALALFTGPTATPEVGLVVPTLTRAFPFTATPTIQLTNPASPSATGAAGNPVIAGDTPTPTASPTLAPSPTPLPTELPLTPTPEITPIGGGTGEIAFASDRSGTTQIWILDVDDLEAGPWQLTDIPEGACQPVWSPDGNRLVFISPCDKNRESYPGAGLFMINADGSEQMPLTTVSGGDYDPAWSPDGKYIAFTSLRNSGRPRIYVLNLEDSSVVRLSAQYSYDRQPDWAPDGSKLAFVTTQKGPVQVWTMEPDGGNQIIYSRSADATNTHPIWLPTGEGILFTQIDRAGGIPGVVSASYIDSEYSEFRFNLGPIPVREARFSPDGLWLVFESWPSGSNHDIYSMTVSGASRTRLTTWERFDFDPAWRPAVKEQAGE